MKTWYLSPIAALLTTAVAFVLATNGIERVKAGALGTIAGTVRLNGPAPAMKTIDMSEDPYCARQNQKNPAKANRVVVGANGGLQNVVLFISAGLSPAAGSTVPSESPTFDQKDCLFRPHVLVVDVGQAFKVASSDQTMHNVHPSPAKGSANVGWNKSLPPGTPPIETSWKAEEVAIPVKCNIHPWMRGWIAVVKGPYAVTDEHGNFTIKNVPAGSYTVAAWQEEYGTRTANVAVIGGQAAKLDFLFDAR